MANEKKLKKDERLINEGSKSDALFLLQEGTLAVIKRHGQEDVLLGHIHPGELVGEMSFLDQSPRSASVVAKTDSIVVEIPHEKFLAIFNKQPGWYQKLIKTLLSRLRDANAKVKV